MLPLPQVQDRILVAPPAGEPSSGSDTVRRRRASDVGCAVGLQLANASRHASERRASDHSTPGDFRPGEVTSSSGERRQSEPAGHALQPAPRGASPSQLAVGRMSIGHGGLGLALEAPAAAPPSKLVPSPPQHGQPRQPAKPAHISTMHGAHGRSFQRRRVDAFSAAYGVHAVQQTPPHAPNTATTAGHPSSQKSSSPRVAETTTMPSIKTETSCCPPPSSQTRNAPGNTEGSVFIGTTCVACREAKVGASQLEQRGWPEKTDSFLFCSQGSVR